MAITKMNRVFIVGPFDHREEVIGFLQEAGVLHVEAIAENDGDLGKKNTIALQKFKKISQTVDAIKQYKKMENKTPVPVPDDELVSYTEEKLSLLLETQNRIHELRRLIGDLSVWGDFDPEKIQELEEEGFYVQRFRIDEKKWKTVEVPDDALLEVVLKKREVYFFAISSEKAIEISGASVMPLPKMGLRSAQEEIDSLLVKEGEIVKELSGAADKIDVLRSRYTDALNQVSYTENEAKLYSDEHLFGLQGWVPQDREDELLNKIKESNLDVQVTTRKPLKKEEPPILLKNNWFIRATEPLLKLYGLPRFRDIDPSYFFAPFMILFFGICFSDAGYGLVFFALSWWVRKKWGEKVRGLAPAMYMCEFFAISTLIVGIITGSVFGYNFASRDWIILDVSIGYGDPMLLFYISLGLGVVHLSISYILGIMEAPSTLNKLHQSGVMFVLWGATSLVSRVVWFSGSPSVMNPALYYAGIGFLSLGILLTLLFATDSKNLGIRIGVGVWNVYGLTGLIGDLLSYARLFGLGMATSAIACVMNQLGGMVRDALGPVIGVFLAVIIIILGHTFNFGLSILGGVVHSARLHFVEAFKSFFQGGGIEYKPFKIERG